MHCSGSTCQLGQQTLAIFLCCWFFLAREKKALREQWKQKIPQEQNLDQKPPPRCKYYQKRAVPPTNFYIKKNIKTPHYCKLESHSVLSGGEIKSGYIFFLLLLLCLHVNFKEEGQGWGRDTPRLSHNTAVLQINTEESVLTKLPLGLLARSCHLHLSHFKEVSYFSFIQPAHVVDVGLRRMRGKAAFIFFILLHSYSLKSFLCNATDPGEPLVFLPVGVFQPLHELGVAQQVPV